LKSNLPRLSLIAGGLLLVLVIAFGIASNKNSPPVIAPPSKPQTPALKAKLSVDREGLVSITQADLMAANLNWSAIDLGRLRLFYQGQAEPIWLAGQGADQTLKFYAQASSSRYMTDSVYFLQPGDQAAQFMITQPLSQSAAAAPLDRYTATLQVEQNRVYSPQVAEGDHWFWLQLPAPQSRTFTFTLESAVTGPGRLRLAVWGSTEANNQPDHHLIISINGQKISDNQFDGIARHTIEADIPAGTLIEGGNTLQVSAPGDTGAGADIVYVDAFKVSYPRRFVAQADRLEFDGVAGPVQLIGFSSGPIEIFDITKPESVIHLDRSGSDFSAAFDRRYLAVGPKGYSAARVTRAATDLELRARAGAEYIAIGPEDLLTPLQPLLDWHASQNLTTIAVPAEAIYDQFNDGRAEPEAIRSFLKYAAANWKPVPKYVLLVGDSTYDPLGYSAPPDGNRLPAFFVQTSFGGETASDVEFVRLHDDSPLPDVAIGRVPARTADQVRSWVEKTLAYSRNAPGGDWRQRVLGVADGQEAGFSADAKNFLAAFPQKYQSVLLTPPPNTADANQQIDTKFSEGNLIVAYFGHGSVTQWGKDSLFTVKDAEATSNGDRLPVVLNLTCLTGLFTHPKVQSLAETLLWKQAGGAVAVLAPTSLTLSSDQSFLSRAWVAEYVADPARPLGDLLLNAWWQIPIENAGTLDVLRTFLLFGDPALKLAGP
jgi:hypothetical protein